MSKLTIGSFFAGVGGIDLGFEQTNKFKTVYANEIDKNAITTYEANFDVKVDNRSIRDVKASEIPDFDVFVGGFPCQTFSIAGHRKGFDDKDRGTLFFEIVRLLKEKKELGKQPKIVFFENVKHLVNHDSGNTFKVVKEELQKLGYFLKYKVLNSKKYGGIPQNRERIYIVGFLEEEQHKKFVFPEETPISKTNQQILKPKVDKKYSYENSKIYTPLKNSNLQECIFYTYRKSRGCRRLVDGCCHTLLASHSSIPIVKVNGVIRKTTPRECFDIQGFPQSYKLPKIPESHLYKQVGNSVTVTVIKRIAQNIL